jgi:hypothetical protein
MPLLTQQRKNRSVRRESIPTTPRLPQPKESRSVKSIYTYYADPKGKEKAKREEGIYTYYADATVKERSAQDFADDVVKRE